MSEVIDQNFIPRSRHQWTMQIGMFLSRLAEIERQTHVLRLLSVATPEQNVIKPLALKTLTKTWVNFSFEERLERLIDQSSKNTNLADCKSYLEAIRPLLDIRNVVSHGSFAMKDGSTPDSPNYCMWCYPEKSACAVPDGCPPKSSVVHIEQLEAAMIQAMHIISGLTRFTDAFCKRDGFDISDTLEEQLSDDQRYASAVLQLAIGKLIVASGEIECMVVLVYQKILDPEYEGQSLDPKIKLTGYWLHLTLKEKVDDLLMRLPSYKEFQFLRHVLEGVRELITFRNTRAHSMIRYEISETGALELAAVRLKRSGLSKMPASVVKNRIIKSMRLSDDLSEAIAVVGFLLHRERRAAYWSNSGSSPMTELTHSEHGSFDDQMEAIDAN